jgi:hypothetical protein
MEDYIVRIYRRRDENGGLFGVVEEVGVEGRKPFRSMSELVALLRGNPPNALGAAERIRLPVPVMVEGKDASGRPFVEDTVIETMSPRGARLRLETPVREGDDLQVVLEPGCCARRMGARVGSVARGPAPRIVEVIFG